MSRSASHPGVTPNARPGRVPVAEHRIFVFLDKYACDLVSHWRAKRRRVVPGSREARLLTRRALARQRGSKARIRTRRPAIWEVVLLREPTGACSGQRTQGGRGKIGCRVGESILGTWMSQNLSRGSDTLGSSGQPMRAKRPEVMGTDCFYCHARAGFCRWQGAASHRHHGRYDVFSVGIAPSATEFDGNWSAPRPRCRQ